jgi:hypothetical protein
LGRLVSVAQGLAELFGGDEFFQCLLALGNVETHLNLFLGILPCINHCESNLDALLNRLNEISGCTIPNRLIAVVFQCFELEFDHAQFLLNRIRPPESETDILRLCSVCTAAIRHSVEITDLIINSGFINPLFECASSDNLLLVIPILSFFVSLMKCKKDIKGVVMQNNLFPSLTRLLDSELESETVLAIEFLCEIVPEFISSIFENIPCDLLWPILYDGIVLGGIDLMKASARLTQRMIGIHDEFDFAFLHDDFCAIGVRLLDLDEDEFTEYCYALLEFAVNVAERNPNDRLRFLKYWSESELAEQLEESELRIRISRLFEGYSIS